MGARILRSVAAGATLLLANLAFPASAREPVHGPEHAPGPESGEEQRLVEELSRLADGADPARIVELARLGSAEALEGLVSVYDRMYSLFMRREILRTLPGFVPEVADAKAAGGDSTTLALAKLTAVGAASPMPELRSEAISLLAGLGSAGRPALRAIADDASVEVETRAEALARHVETAAGEADRDWYDELLEPRRKGEPVPGRLRLLAFEALREELKSSELVAAARKEQLDIRRAALAELFARDHRRTESLARDLAEDRGVLVAARMDGARILLAVSSEPVRGARELVSLATAASTPRELSFGIADLLAPIDDEAVRKLLLRGLANARGRERDFFLSANRHVENELVDEELERSLASDDEREVRMALELLRLRGSPLAQQALRQELEGEDPARVADALWALDRVRDDREWVDLLVERSSDPSVVVRNAALEALAGRTDPRVEGLLVAALDDPRWETRLLAAHGIEARRSRIGVGALCERIAEERGRTLHEMAEILWRMTGEPHGRRGRAWQAWWKAEGKDFEVLSPEEFGRIEAELELVRSKRVTRASFVTGEGEESVLAEEEGVFFGLRVVSERIVFVLDLSGSMDEPLSEAGGERKSRLRLATEELRKLIDGLEADARFDILSMDGGGAGWGRGMSRADEEGLAAAHAFLDAPPRDFQTDVYGALKAAFDIEGVDTIYVVSDGESTAGELVDPWEIRLAVGEWNRHRELRIHTIAVGKALPLLAWLAEDSGGSHAAFH